MDKYSYHKGRHNSNSSSHSFSSTLLDAIYHSIDKGEDELMRETMRKKHSSNRHGRFHDNLTEDQEHNKGRERVVIQQKSAANFEKKSRSNIKTSSSDSSSCGNVFSELECVYEGVLSSGSSCYGLNRPKPIRTLPKDLNLYETDFAPAQQKAKQEGGFIKTKYSRALKIYGDLKKVKQPISPGGRLASFLNSLFNAGEAKKSNQLNVASSKLVGVGYNYDRDDERKLRSEGASPSAASSSLSRSCLSKKNSCSTPSSRTKPISNGTKRSVKFYPLRVIVDEDCDQPCGHKNVYDEQPCLDAVRSIRNKINEELKVQSMEKNRRGVEEAARDFLKNYQKFDDEDEDEDDDEAASCASSDLFELDNLSTIGEELPVYETTHLDINRAIIAKGLI